jgi:NTP pyrophosphatase (non-canonical NTP hydrolase)
MNKTKQLNILTEKVSEIMRMYEEEFPDVHVDRDYFPFKLTEELGECLQKYLMLTDRGRQKGMTKEEIRSAFQDELGDVFGFLLLFAKKEGIDLEEALEKKWFVRLKK